MRLPSLKFLEDLSGRWQAARASSSPRPSYSLRRRPVSHQIKALERQLGVQLFERGTRSLALTAAGARYLKQIDDVFARLQSVTEQLKARYGRTIVRLHAPPFFASELLLPRLASFSQAHDALDILIETSVPHPRTHAPEADLSIVVGFGPWDGLRRASAVCAELRARMCPALLAASTRFVHSTDLDAGTLIVDEGRRDDWDRWADANGLERLRPGQLLRLDTMSAVIRAAEKGLGIALVPAALSARRFKSGRLTRLFAAELADATRVTCCSRGRKMRSVTRSTN